MNIYPTDSDEIDALRQRTEQLELIMMDYLRLEELIEHAEHGHDLNEYAASSSLDVDSLVRLSAQTAKNNGYLVNSLLYVDPVTQQIIDANQTALAFTGYTKDELLGRSITELEIPGEGSTTVLRSYIESSIEEQVYQALYRHRTGRQLLVHVYKRLLHRGEQAVLHYRLEDKSLHGRVWHELKRREQGSVEFYHKLRVLNEITIELSKIQDFDSFCRQAVVHAIERLGFDRMGLWFLNKEHKIMVGSYGIDEKGVIRPEQDQRWSYADTYVEEFIRGNTELVFAYDESPIYNEKSEIIDYGWHISAPVLDHQVLVGVLMVDNYLHKRPIRVYEPELLRLYGMTLGYLVQLIRGIS